MEKKNDMISVIVPVYNSASYLKKCLNSILHQTYQNFEIICINDGSTDESEQILREYEKEDQRIKVASIENGGQANARNIGIEQAEGEFICFVDSDDVIDPWMLEKLYTSCVRYGSDLSFCYIKRVYEGTPPLMERFYKFDLTLDFYEHTTIFEHPEIICYLTNGPVAKLVRRSFLNEHQIRFVKGYIYEDLLFTQTLLSYNPTISKVDEQLYGYIIHGNSTMTSRNSKVTDMFYIYDEVYQAYARKGLDEQFRNELEFLCLYHVMIGTSYRMWRSGRYGVVQSIKECKTYVIKYAFQTKNAYLDNKGWISRLFVKIALF